MLNRSPPCPPLEYDGVITLFQEYCFPTISHKIFIEKKLHGNKDLVLFTSKAPEYKVFLGQEWIFNKYLLNKCVR